MISFHRQNCWNVENFNVIFCSSWFNASCQLSNYTVSVSLSAKSSIAWFRAREKRTFFTSKCWKCTFIRFYESKKQTISRAFRYECVHSMYRTFPTNLAVSTKSVQAYGQWRTFHIHEAYFITSIKTSTTHSRHKINPYQLFSGVAQPRWYRERCRTGTASA